MVVPRLSVQMLSDRECDAERTLLFRHAAVRGLGGFKHEVHRALSMVEIHKSAQYSEWFNALRDRQTRARIDARVFRLAHGNPGQHRVLTQGVVEMKIDFGPGYRVYFMRRGTELVLLLIGDDKSTRQRDIDTAIQLAQEQTS